ncbi:MAG: T9SS type A sorting domain-containing protein [Bacteroidia bacterium]|nr:T9SS type A sorting domain-containing protein [Bacteroidia bacterium]
MKKTILFFLLALTSLTKAQLPTVAQALWQEAWLNDSNAVMTCNAIGAQTIATPDGNSFYVKWFPNGATPANTPVIVTLHGSNGFAFHELINWHNQAQLHGCGIISLQWYRGQNAVQPYDYFDDSALHNFIDSALTAINYPSGKAFLHGFSRGSARSYGIILNDILANNYFCTVLSNAGGANPLYPLYAQIDSGNFGANVYAGKHWAMFCGGQDPTPTISGCPAMNDSKTWVEAKGATVDFFIQDPAADHDGFHFVPAYIDSVLNYYLACYSGTISVKEESLQEIVLFPNPTNDQLSIQIPLKEKIESIIIYNSIGQLVEKIKIETVNKNTEFTFSTANYKSGIYYLLIKTETGILKKSFVKE